MMYIHLENSRSTYNSKNDFPQREFYTDLAGTRKDEREREIERETERKKERQIPKEKRRSEEMRERERNA